MSPSPVWSSAVRRLKGYASVAAATALVLGCATRKPDTVSSTFIRQGNPAIDLGGPARSATTESYIAQLRKLAAEARPRAKSVVPDVAEVRDPVLRERLTELRAAPTAERHREVALEYRRLGILDAAYSHLSTAIRLSPKDAAAYDLRARIWRAWGLPQLGLRDARKAVDLAPQSATAWNTLGLLLEGSGNLEHSTKAYLRAAVIDGDAGYVWANLCRTWTVQSDAMSAVQACRRALSIDPTLQAASLHLQQVERLLTPFEARIIAVDRLAATATSPVDRRAGEPTLPPAQALPLDADRVGERTMVHP